MATFFKVFFIVLTTVISKQGIAQEIVGSWTGSLDIQDTDLPVIFDVSKGDGTFTTTLTSPKQSPTPISVDTTIIEGSAITFRISAIGAKYSGTLEGQRIQGTFSQGGGSFPLLLEKKAYEKKAVIRPQTPIAPFPYDAHEVVFENSKASNIKLSGTLTLPKSQKKPKVAILISGSGGQNRDEELMEHKPFWIIADYLSRNNIAVLRFDDRGIGQSEGTHEGATSADFVTDVEAAIEYLKTRKDIDASQIGLIGHSEGGLIAAMVAANPENKLAFIVSLAGTGVAGDEVILSQHKKIGALGGKSELSINYGIEVMKKACVLIKTTREQEALMLALEDLIKKAAAEAPGEVKSEYTKSVQELYVRQLTDPWLQYFIQTNPRDYWKQTTCAVLALNGDKDAQVLPGLNLPAIKSALEEAGNTKFKIQELAGLNHLFQHSETGAPTEYAILEETFAPEALSIMTAWIEKL